MLLTMIYGIIYFVKGEYMKKFLADLKNLRWQNFVMLFIAGCINAFGVNRFQISKMRGIIHKIDPKAFVTISDVADVFKAND